MALAVVVAVAGTVFVLDGRAHRTAAAPPSARVSTATVVRTDLSNSQTLPGTLGFGAPVPLTGKGTGVVTRLPAAGATVSRGQSLYRADDRPVIVFYGDTPLFRTLAPPPITPPPKTPELSGRDVTVVAQNLRALGYQIGHQPSSATTSGYVYTAALAAAVRRWQRAVGMVATGTLDVGQVVVFPGAVRVNAIQAQLGDPVAEPLMSVTPTDKVITVPVAATDMNDIVSGAGVTVGLPDDRQIPGTVTSISQAVQSNSGQDPDNPTATPTLNVGVTPLHDADVAQLAAAPVQVTFTTGVRKGVLAVPVTALLALSGGGYALQRTDGTLVGIRTGLFADGLVEVSGTGVTAGLRVQTAS